MPTKCWIAREAAFVTDKLQHKINDFDLADLANKPSLPQKQGPADVPDKVLPTATESTTLTQGTGNAMREVFKDKSISKGMKECQGGESTNSTMIDSKTCLRQKGFGVGIIGQFGGKD